MATAAQQAQMQVDFTQVINELANRLRILEGKQNLFSERLLVMNQNMIEEYKKIQKDIKNIHAELDNLKKDLGNVKSVVRHLTEEASKFARNEDVKTMQKYVELWNPLTFVTEKDVKRMIEEAMRHRGMREEESEEESLEAAKEMHDTPAPEKESVFVDQPLVPEKHTKKAEHKVEEAVKHAIKEAPARTPATAHHTVIPHLAAKPKETKKGQKKKIAPTNIDEVLEGWMGE